MREGQFLAGQHLGREAGKPFGRAPRLGRCGRLFEQGPNSGGQTRDVVPT